MASKKQSLLTSVNVILSNIGQAPVTNLETPNPMVDMARGVLEEINRGVQSEGWVFNTEAEYPLPIDSKGFISIPENVLSIDTDRLDNRTAPVIRDGRLYDKKNHTYKWQKAQTVDLVWLFDFEDLPEAFKNYITIRAANIFAMRVVGSNEVAKYSEREEAAARAAVMEYETQQGDYNILGNKLGQAIVPGYMPINTIYRY